MINRVVLVGRLTRDPELRRTTSGMSVASFTIAVDNRVKAGGEKSASFIPCTVWSQTADNVAKFTRKGSLVGIDGRLNQRSYDSKEGKKVSIVEVVCDSVQFLEPKGANAPEAESASFPPSEPAPETSKNLSSIDIVDDDLPF
ncbi:MAG: single-stranded DNA-binding protein [Firmicutes bacterium]|nr:single-stranded DNA-binding protein [Bacillota bacterium]